VVSHKETAIEIVGISDVFHVDCTILHQGYQGPRQCDRHFPHQSIDSDRKSQGTSPARGVGHFEKEQLASCWIWRRMNWERIWTMWRYMENMLLLHCCVVPESQCSMRSCRGPTMSHHMFLSHLVAHEEVVKHVILLRQRRIMTNPGPLAFWSAITYSTSIETTGSGQQPLQLYQSNSFSEKKQSALWPLRWTEVTCVQHMRTAAINT